MAPEVKSHFFAGTRPVRHLDMEIDKK